jgi:kinesin family protein C2/C3
MLSAQVTPGVMQQMRGFGRLLEAVNVKYKREMVERKKLHNIIQELKGNIRVYCRCRPISSAELERGATDATAFGDLDDVAIFSPDGTKKSFEFDRTFDQSSTQEAVFEDTLPLMQSVLDGFNVCIFAYGQTGSGKTFTMQGPDENPGVNIRSLQKLFTLVSEKGDDFEFEMGIAIFEIYCDQLRDLLVKDSPDLKIRQDKRNGRVHNFVDGLSQRVVASVDDVNQTIALANSNRSTASTNMNAYSSRSHLIMTVEVATIDKLSNKRTQAALHMIDLAGSERVGRSGVQGQALKEAQFINQSLAALGNTLSALGRKDGHVPYRDSKLTHSLADALGGNSKVLMFCNISPSSDNVSETLSSLQFATRARAVELGKATANVSGSDKPPAELADEDEAPAAAAPAAASKGRTSSAAARPSTKLPAAKAAGRAAPAAAAAGRAKPSPRATTTTPRASLGARKPAVAGRK